MCSALRLITPAAYAACLTAPALAESITTQLDSSDDNDDDWLTWVRCCPLASGGERGRV